MCQGFSGTYGLHRDDRPETPQAWKGAPMTAPVRTRPVLITLLVALVVLGAIGWIVEGIVVLGSFAAFQIVGVICVLLGLVYLAVAKGLLDGNPMSRSVVAVVAVLQIVWAVVSWIITDHEYQNSRSSATGSAVLAVIILFVLFSPKATAFFERRS